MFKTAAPHDRQVQIQRSATRAKRRRQGHQSSKTYSIPADIHQASSRDSCLSQEFSVGRKTTVKVGIPTWNRDLRYHTTDQSQLVSFQRAIQAL
jgi:hypothetical protein